MNEEMTKELIDRLRTCPERSRNTIDAADAIDVLTAENARLAMHIKHIGNDALRADCEALRRNNCELTDQRFDLMVQVSTLLCHMDTISNCTNDPAISSLARVVLERFEAQKAGK